ncbi:MAG TPA: metallophosphoesterase [Lacipirellulaceae bacterium]|jgi:3',5'-cyclic AMP phosphodiesterase CpdA|nr:metallophosphoesterase [Lacipirellulaceae bacterium]
MSHPIEAARISRREALRRTVLFSTAALATGGRSFLRAKPVETNFESGGLDLLAIGDYGTRGDVRQVSVARAMTKFAKSLDQPLTAVLALGDNFYKPITPNRFQDHFENMYSKDGLDCPFYACAGNHDYGPKYDPQEGKLQMQLDYTKNNPTSRWKFPSKWYTLELPSADKPLVKMIVLDGNYWEGALTPQEKIDQRRFLKAELKKKSAAPWLWLVNHFPIFSDGHGHGDNTGLIREWGKLLQDYPVSLCLAGHDHIMQHVQVADYHPSFIVNGAGGAALYKLNDNCRGYVNNANLGFNHIHVTPDKFDVQFITADGDCLHHFQRTQKGEVAIKA